MVALIATRADSPKIALRAAHNLALRLGSGDGCPFCAAVAFAAALSEGLAGLEPTCECGRPSPIASVPGDLAEFMRATRDLLALEPGDTACRACRAARCAPDAPCPTHAQCASHAVLR